MKSTFKMLALAGAMSSLLAGEVQASTLFYTLNQSNLDSILSDGVSYLTVKIEDNQTFGADADAVKFTVDIIDGVSNFGADTGIQAFGFNRASGAPELADGNIVGPSGWSGKATNNGFDGFGKFSGSTNGTGQTRMNPLEFWITGVVGDTASSYAAASSGNANQGSAWFSAHVTGITIADGTLTTGYFGGGNGINTPPPGGDVSQVPLPAAVWMFGAGLMAVSRLKPRKSLAA